MCQSLFTIRLKMELSGRLYECENTRHVRPLRRRRGTAVKSDLLTKRRYALGRPRAPGPHGHGVKGKIDISRPLGPRTTSHRLRDDQAAATRQSIICLCEQITHRRIIM